MAKGKSWGVANDMYEKSELGQANRKIAMLTGTIHRVCGLLGLAADHNELDGWCAAEDRRRREEKENNSEVTQ